jgi:hypothetical protein
VFNQVIAWLTRKLSVSLCRFRACAGWFDKVVGVTQVFGHFVGEHSAGVRQHGRTATLLL